MMSSQSELQMFSIDYRHMGGPHGDSIQNPIKLCEMLRRISEMMYRTDLRIGEVLKRIVSSNIPSSWPFSLHDFESIFLLRDSETISNNL